MKSKVGFTNRRIKIVLLLFAGCLLSAACSKSKPDLVEAPPTFQPSPEAPIVQVPTVVAPKAAEVKDAIERVFKGAVVIDSSSKPSFIAGDFNGDAIQDIAVVVRPAAGKLDDLNQQYPPWVLRDPFTPEIQKTEDFRVDDNEILLAIIHGYGPNDWRDPQATQTFLLKNAVGSGMGVHKGVEFVKANSGKKLPAIAGDLIEENVRGKHGYLYFSVLTYRWFDPKTFKGEPARRVAHPIMARNR
jgi:hypothetical protein